MGLFDNISNILSGGGQNEVNRGYNRANDLMNPYYQQGMGNYNNFQKYGNDRGSELEGYGNPADWMYKQINQSPMDYYSHIMGNYNESPDAKYAQDEAYKAATRGASASGMLGSGAFFKGLQTNANDISQRDRQQYYNNVMNTNKSQMDYLQNFQGQQDKYAQIQQYLAGLGYNAGSAMGQNDINQGMASSQFRNNAMEDIFGGLGAGAQAYGNRNNNGGNGFNAYNMPAYAKNAMGF